MFNTGYDYENNVDINKTYRQYRRFKDMYYIIEKEFYPELINEIDLGHSIIISSPNQYNFIRRNRFGKLDVLASQDINLSTCASVNEYLKKFNCVPKIKVMVPKGIELNIENPNNNYTNTIYSNFNTEFRKHHKSNINDRLIYDRMEFDIYVDVKQFLKTNPTYLIKFDIALFTMSFNPMCYVGSVDHVNEVNDIYWIKNDELFRTFEDTF